MPLQWVTKMAVAENIYQYFLTFNFVVMLIGGFLIVLGILNRQDEGSQSEDSHSRTSSPGHSPGAEDVRSSETALRRAERKLFKGKKVALNELLLVRYEVHAYAEALSAYNALKKKSGKLYTQLNVNGSTEKLKDVKSAALKLGEHLQAGIKKEGRTVNMNNRAFRMYNSAVSTVRRVQDHDKKYAENVRDIGKLDFHEKNHDTLGSYNRLNVKEHVDYLKLIKTKIDAGLHTLQREEKRLANELKLGLHQIVTQHEGLDGLRDRSKKVYKLYKTDKVNRTKLSKEISQIRNRTKYALRDQINQLTVQEVLENFKEKPFKITLGGNKNKSIKKLSEDWNKFYGDLAAHVQKLTELMDEIDKVEGLEEKLEKMVEQQQQPPPPPPTPQQPSQQPNGNSNPGGTQNQSNGATP